MPPESDAVEEERFLFSYLCRTISVVPSHSSLSKSRRFCSGYDIFASVSSILPFTHEVLIRFTKRDSDHPVVRITPHTQRRTIFLSINSHFVRNIIIFILLGSRSVGSRLSRALFGCPVCGINGISMCAVPVVPFLLILLLLARTPGLSAGAIQKACTKLKAYFSGQHRTTVHKHRISGIEASWKQERNLAKLGRA